MPSRFLKSNSAPPQEGMAPREQGVQLDRFELSGLTIICIVLVSAIYFADIFLKASRKCFWFDELFTVYLCRLPSFAETWGAVTHGADFNPPLFYLLTRGAQRLFGDGLVATRLPAMIGVWLFCICLFFFVAKRAGAVSGFIAGAFPFFTLVQYYAYEARAHGIVLGWCGLALFCWQKSAEERATRLWVAGFGLSLLAALLTHIYAVYLLVPFAVVEFYSLVRGRRPDWSIIAVLATVPSAVIVAVYLPLFHAYRTSMPTVYFPASHDLVERFLSDAVGPAIPILMVWLVLSALPGIRFDTRSNARDIFPQREKLLAGVFASIPILGLIGCKVSHGPFLDRYFLSSIAGYAIFLGFSTARWPVASRTGKLFAGCMFLFLIVDLGSTIYLSTKHRIVLIEPSSGVALTTTPSDPMALYATVAKDDSGLDILVLPNIEYLYFFRYAAPSLVSRLYFGAPANDVFLTAQETLAKTARIGLKVTTFAPFLSTHRRFLIYDRGDVAHVEAEQAIATGGYKLISAKADAGGTMYEYSK